MMLNDNLKSTAVMLITKKYYFTFLGNHISHNFTIHIQKHNYYKSLISLCSSLTQSQTANNTTDVGHVFIISFNVFNCY